jgi:hypothetical protein
MIPQNHRLKTPLIVSSTCVGYNELVCTSEECRDCQMNEWGEWGVCSQTCGGGVRERFRDFTPGTKAGKACPCNESQKEKQYCNAQPCVGE